MEATLEQRLGDALKGAAFPQFAEEWGDLLDEGRRTAKVVSEDGCRVRVGLSCKGAGRFAALFLSLAGRRIDLFLFNPSWGENERQEALAAAKLDWWIEQGGVSGISPEESRQEEYDETLGFRVMIPTGGTGGRVKFAIHDWETLSAAVEGVRERFGGSVMNSHCVLPLYHVSGFMQLVRAVLTGGRVVFGSVDSFAGDHRLLFEEVQGDCFMSLVPTQLERILCDEAAIPLMRAYRTIFIGGGPCSTRLLAEAAECELPLSFSYGMTETAAQVATLMPDEFLNGNRAAGRCLSHASIDICDRETGEVLEANEIGIINVRASSLFRGYWGRDVFGGEVYETSDLGSLDEAGFLTVVGRVDRVIISGGEKIDLSLVEKAIEGTGLVTEVVAFGVEDRDWGEALAVAFVPRDSGCEGGDLEAALSGILTKYLIPKIWRRVDALPRNEAGKLLRGRLLELV